MSLTLGETGGGISNSVKEELCQASSKKACSAFKYPATRSVLICKGIGIPCKHKAKTLDMMSNEIRVQLLDNINY